jgi:hypothetical protein
MKIMYFLFDIYKSLFIEHTAFQLRARGVELFWILKLQTKVKQKNYEYKNAS